MRKLLLFAMVLFIAIAANGQDVRYSESDVTEFNRIMNGIGTDSSLPTNELVIKIAKMKLGTPYVAFTLEKDPEMLTVNMNETDCILFVEMCLALALTSREEEPSFEKYCEILRNLRYRNGVVDGYASRLHYTSGWIIQGHDRGIFDEVTGQCGGKPYDQRFNYMSTHPDSYRQIKEDPSLIKGISQMEKWLEQYDYYVIAKEDLPACIKDIKSGDIIGFNSSVPGLDIAHVGYACWFNGELTFIHASYSAKKVIINETPLVEYTNGIKSHNGLRVIRLR